MFEPFMKSFYVRSTDSTHIKTLKVTTSLFGALCAYCTTMSAGEIHVCECVEKIGCGRIKGTNYMNSAQQYSSTQRQNKELIL